MKKTTLLAIVITSSITAYPALTKAMMLGTGDFAVGGGSSVEVEVTLASGPPYFRISWYIGPEHVGDTLFVSAETDAYFGIAAYVLSNGVPNDIWVLSNTGGGSPGPECSFFTKSPGVDNEYCDFHGCNITAISLTVNALTLDHPSDSRTNYTFDVTFTVWGDPPIPKPAMIYYVDADANGVNDGSSWTDAYNYLQDALTVSSSGDEIWVAQGIYKPDQGAWVTPGDRTATFQPINGVAIRGGYAGFGEPDPNARDIDTYESILSGDLAGNDVDVNNPADLLYEPTRAENSYHVVTGSGTDTTAVLDGFEIISGNANGSSYSQKCGGGMYNEEGSPTLSNCTFVGNSAPFGGGMFNSESGPTLSNCTFSRNSAYELVRHPPDTGDGGGMHNDKSSPKLTNCTFSYNSADDDGGGMYNSDSSLALTNCIFTGNSARGGGGGMVNGGGSLTLKDCIFSGNSARSSGGGMTNYVSSPTVTNCTFTGNTGHSGGGMYTYSGNPALTNCTFSGNSVGGTGKGGGMLNLYGSPKLTNCTFTGNSGSDISSEGGGIFNRGYRSSRPTLMNCTFAANSATYGNALACGGREGGSSPQLTNCILWDGGDEVYNEDHSVITITYSDVQGGWAGEGNIDADPCFADPGYWEDPCNTPAHLWDDLWVDGDYHLLPDSPCIDAGDPNYVVEPNETDLDGRPRVIGGRIDMGAYEYSLPVPAEVRIVPRTINLASKGKWITCYIWLGEEYDVADIDPNSVLLEGEIEPEWFSVDEQQQIVIVRFSRSEVQDILQPGDVELTVSGELGDGTIFEGTDTIRVIDKGRRK